MKGLRSGDPGSPRASRPSLRATLLHATTSAISASWSNRRREHPAEHLHAGAERPSSSSAASPPEGAADDDQEGGGLDQEPMCPPSSTCPTRMAAKPRVMPTRLMLSIGCPRGQGRGGWAAGPAPPALALGRAAPAWRRRCASAAGDGLAVELAHAGLRDAQHFADLAAGSCPARSRGPSRSSRARADRRWP